MAISGALGKVYFIENACPNNDVNDCTGNWAAPGGDSGCWQDEVTEFSFDDSVAMEKFGTDKSQGCQDTCAGTWGAEIRIDAKRKYSSSGTPSPLLHAGRTLYLILYPLGGQGCGETIQGYATIERVSRRFNIQQGQAIGYTATLASKGPWTGLGDLAWGGFECACGGNATGGGNANEI
jgi:hypothetical protein